MIYKRVKPNLKRIDLWSIRLKSIVIIATIFFIGILGYFFYIRPVLERKEKILFEFQSFKKKLNSQLELSSEYTNYQKRIEKIKTKFDIYSQQLNFGQMPQPCSNLDVYHSNCKLSDNTDKNSNAKSIYSNDSIDKIILNALSSSFTPFFKINKIHIFAIKKDFLNSMQVESNFSGTNNTIFNFLYQITRLNKFIITNKFSWNFFNDLSKNQKQNIIFSFKIYFPYSNRKNLILALSKINKLDTNSIYESNLTKYPLRKIKMLGFLSTGKYQNWGFVSLPNKQICKLKLGDYLGLERGIVVGIYVHEIFIQNNSLDKIIKLNIGEKKFPYVKNYAQ